MVKPASPQSRNADLTPSDYYLHPKMKKKLRGCHFDCGNVIIAAVV